MVSRRLAIERRLKEVLAEAVEAGTPVDGKVVGRRKGGFDVTIAGVRGFCPLSQIDDMRSDDLDRHLGQSYQFRVLEYDPDARKLVVSRSALLKEEKAKLRQETWDRIEAGTVLEGRIRSLTDFGAFVDLGGVDGMIHVTEISHRRVGKPADLLAVGDPVRVKVLEVDRGKKRIALSIKQLQKDPWGDVPAKYPAKAPFTGTVVRKAAFGVFVEIEPGIDGLLHVSQLPPGVELDAAELEVGQTVEGWVRELDIEHQRIGLTLRRLPDHDPWERIEMRYQEGQTVEGVVENGADFGVFVELEAGVSALIPTSELSTERDVDPRTVMSPGERVTAKVLSVDPERHRISLSLKAHRRDVERQEYSQHLRKGSEKPSLSGFGQQLLAALGKKQD